MTHNPKPKPKTQNPKPKTRSPKPSPRLRGRWRRCGRTTASSQRSSLIRKRPPRTMVGPQAGACCRVMHHVGRGVENCLRQFGNDITHISAPNPGVLLSEVPLYSHSQLGILQVAGQMSSLRENDRRLSKELLLLLYYSRA